MLLCHTVSIGCPPCTRVRNKPSAFNGNVSAERFPRFCFEMKERFFLQFLNLIILGMLLKYLR